MKQDIDLPDVRWICAGQRIQIQDLRSITGSFGKRIFIINREFLLRVSAQPMTAEQEKFSRVAALEHVPKIVHTGSLERAAGPVYYTLLTLLPGDDFVHAYAQTTAAQQKRLGADIARFLDRLQELRGTQYDIGLYVPALPPFSGTWREGHQHYWQLLQQGSESLTLQPETRRVFDRAFRFLQASGPALDFQTGPRLLHNDFHPQNIILDRGRFSGVIDWECSQYGEADFDLCHFIHWCVYPPQPDMDFRIFLRALFAASPNYPRVPGLARRLAVYQVEHELQQIIWNPAAAEPVRVPRLVRWMDGAVEALLEELGA